MARKAVTKLEVVFEQAKASDDEISERISDAFAILFEETLKAMQEQKLIAERR